LGIYEVGSELDRQEDRRVKDTTRQTCSGKQKWDSVLLEQECREMQTQFEDNIENMYSTNNGILMRAHVPGYPYITIIPVPT
jgi:hypothetical protein